MTGRRSSLDELAAAVLSLSGAAAEQQPVQAAAAPIKKKRGRPRKVPLPAAAGAGEDVQGHMQLSRGVATGEVFHKQKVF